MQPGNEMDRSFASLKRTGNRVDVILSGAKDLYEVFSCGMEKRVCLHPLSFHPSTFREEQKKDFRPVGRKSSAL